MHMSPTCATLTSGDPWRGTEVREASLRKVEAPISTCDGVSRRITSPSRVSRVTQCTGDPHFARSLGWRFDHGNAVSDVDASALLVDAAMVRPACRGARDDAIAAH